MPSDLVRRRAAIRTPATLIWTTDNELQRHQLVLQSLGHLSQRPIGPPQRLLAGRVYEVVPPPASSTLLCGFSDVRFDETFSLHPLQRDVDDADREVADDALLDVAADGRPPRPVTEAQQRQQDNLFKFTN